MKNHLNFLDRLRGAAIISVVALHANNLILEHLPTSSILNQISELNVLLRHGVELFFTLSGFLMSYLYDKSGTNLQFLSARFFRLWPLWCFFTVGWFVVHTFRGDGSISYLIGQTISNLLYVGWAFPGTNNGFVGGQWSIQIEVFCYLIFLFIRGRTNDTLNLTLICVNLVGIANNTVVRFASGQIATPLSNLSVWSGFSFFTIGAIAARTYNKGSFTTWRTWREAGTKSTLVSTFAIITTLVAPAYYGNFLEALGFVMATVALVALLSNFNRPSRALTWFGKHSYSMFFTNFFVLAATGALLGNKLMRFEMVPIIWITTFGFSALMAMATMRFIEAPLIRLGKSRFVKIENE